MSTNQKLLEWVDKNIERVRRNAMHAYSRGDRVAFENINKELGYWMDMAAVLEEKENHNGDGDV